MLLRSLFENADLESQGLLVYHVSPLPKFDGTRKTSIESCQDLYNQLSEEADELEDDIERWDELQKQMKMLDKLERALKTGNRAFGDNGQIDSDSFYASSQPEYWLDEQSDELGIDYRDWETDRKSTRLNSSH